MADLQRAYTTREIVLKRLSEDLLGGESELTLNEPPLSRFVLGILHPEVDDSSRGIPQSIEDDVEAGPVAEAGGDGPDNVTDPGVSLARVRHPRSVGMTVAVEQTPDISIAVEVTASRYEQRDPAGWKRLDLPSWRHAVPVGDPGLRRIKVTEGLDLVTHVRRPTDGVVSVTLTLVNTLTSPRGQKDAFCWFRPRLRVSAIGGRLRERPPITVAGLDERELASQRLLFRDVRSFGVGHGCAVSWEGDSPDTVETTFMPRHELLISEAAGGANLDFSMDILAEDNRFEVLDRLVDEYESWIAYISTHEADGSDEECESLRCHVAEATQAAARMRAGVELLRSDEHVRRAFQLTNLAMAQQRVRQEFHRSGNLGNPPSTSDATWRPFQLAFILTTLSGLADGNHPDRMIADLLWFPTGGGKTEAYLGIIGISILLRRLRDPNAAGVSVIMRYTLRLLTLQQYQRATGLICALEEIRVRYLPDTAPISIGLWVGQASTPNDVETARKALTRARKPGSTSSDDDRSDPVQLRQCPWCGYDLDHRNYEIVDRTWMRVACGVDICAFRDGLPVHIIDSDVYAARPSLVIGTVDKFAMMPWKREVGYLLGVEGLDHGQFRSLSPDLIVQDELHLISGPLGTMVGLYETAVDAIIGVKSRAKVVTSTATIRRATEQVRAVFAREARQFPPAGATYKDSYFAVEAPRDAKASREYMGVMAPGASQTTLMVRVYASLLQSAATIPVDDETADLYWTLLGYFNSLRVLGGAYIQVLDDVPDQMKVIAGRRDEEQRIPRAVREMTSRKRSSEIPQELKILERRRGEAEAADVVLATNMISVGVDVDRLGLMVVMGQPQMTSEYIQATSRVGRRMPGLVVTVYNSGRSRDLSHYENFAAYHRMLYRHVEATGATPFAPRARDRALHAVLVALARHRIPEAASSAAAKNAAEYEDELQAQIEVILERARDLASGVKNQPEDESEERIRQELENLVDAWVESRTSHYEGWFGKSRGALLVETSRMLGQQDPVATLPPRDPPWPTLTSMRDVDAESSVYLVRRRRSRRER